METVNLGIIAEDISTATVIPTSTVTSEAVGITEATETSEDSTDHNAIIIIRLEVVTISEEEIFATRVVFSMHNRKTCKPPNS